MPYIVIKSNGLEIDRRELATTLIVGRAPDCDVTIRDILLSRYHCQLDPGSEGWTLTDLRSKNGTAVNGEKLAAPRVLRDNDLVRMGRSAIIFHAGIPDEDIARRLLSPPRPPDPSDSLAGTLSGFTLLLPGESETPENMPCPQPRPKDPAGYQDEELQTLLSAIASSSWDSIYASASKPTLHRPSSSIDDDGQPRRCSRPRSPTDFSLQVNSVSQPAVADPLPTPLPPALRRIARRMRFISMPRRSREQARAMLCRLPLIAVPLCVAAILMLSHYWKDATGAAIPRPAMAIAAPLATVASIREITSPPPSANAASPLNTQIDVDAFANLDPSPADPFFADSSIDDTTLPALPHHAASLGSFKATVWDARTLKLAAESVPLYAPLFFW